MAHKTLVNYRSDLLQVARWFKGSWGEPFTAAVVTPTNLRDYRSHLITVLITVESKRPATVNRRLAALPKFFGWAKGVGLVVDRPTDAVRGVEKSLRAPKSLDWRETDRLIREAELEGNKRDLVILQTLAMKEATGSIAQWERTLLADIASIPHELDIRTAAWIEEQFPMVYLNGQSEAIRELVSMGAPPGTTGRITPSLGGVHREEMLAASSRPFDVDPRTERQRQAYLAGQRTKRRQREDCRQWERYTAMLPNDTPGFAGFRAMKRANSPRWRELVERYGDARATLRDSSTR